MENRLSLGQVVSFFYAAGGAIQSTLKLNCDFSAPTFASGYGELENQADSVEHIPSSQFTCRCGSPHCRGVIVA